jgi:hypothetical protein
MGQKGIRIIGVVHETLGVDDFRPFLGCADTIYLDTEVNFSCSFSKTLNKVYLQFSEALFWPSTALVATLDGLFALFNLCKSLQNIPSWH